MVRFHWHVEDGMGAFIPPGQMSGHKETGVQHAVVEIELSGQAVNIHAMLTVPPNYLNDAAMSEVGIVLAHGADANDWKSKLLTEIAVTLAKSGYVVMRYQCGMKEQRRQRIFEKTLDACATSPFARTVTRWVLGGIGNGARVAAAVGTRCRGVMAGFAFMAYPLMEPMPNSKGPPSENSVGPLQKLAAPLLFIQPDHDPLCSGHKVVQCLERMPSQDVRILEMQDMDATFKTVSTGKGPMAHTIRQACIAMLDFVNAIAHDRLDACKLPRVKAGSSILHDVVLSQSHAEGLPLPSAGPTAAGREMQAAEGAGTPTPKGKPRTTKGTKSMAVAPHQLQHQPSSELGSLQATPFTDAADTPGPGAVPILALPSLFASSAGAIRPPAVMPAGFVPTMPAPAAPISSAPAAAPPFAPTQPPNLVPNYAMNLASQQILAAAAVQAAAAQAAAAPGKRPPEAEAVGAAGDLQASKRANQGGGPPTVLQLGGPLPSPILAGGVPVAAQPPAQPQVQLPAASPAAPVAQTLPGLSLPAAAAAEALASAMAAAAAPTATAAIPAAPTDAVVMETE